MISQGSLGNLGVNLIHPPKICAGLLARVGCSHRSASPLGTVEDLGEHRDEQGAGGGTAEVRDMVRTPDTARELRCGPRDWNARARSVEGGEKR